MAYYVPLGPRGVLLRIGTALIGLLGAVAYGRGHRRRRRRPLVAAAGPDGSRPDPMMG